MNIQFEVLVSNSTNEPVTLSRLDLQTIGVGPYSLRTSGTPINVKVAPKGTSSHLISVWATARGDAFTASAPVTIRGTAYFDSPSGSFLKIFSENIPPGGR